MGRHMRIDSEVVIEVLGSRFVTRNRLLKDVAKRCGTSTYKVRAGVNEVITKGPIVECIDPIEGTRFVYNPDTVAEHVPKSMVPAGGSIMRSKQYNAGKGKRNKNRGQISFREKVKPSGSFSDYEP